MRYRIDEAGYAGLHAYRSDRIVALPEAGCRIAHPALARPQAVETPKDPGSDLIGVHTGDVTHWFTPAGTAPTVTQRAIGRDWQGPGDGFWQVHPRAPELLAGALLDGLTPQAGETALDLYCGVGLFAGALADAGCRVTAVDSSRAAIAHARRNLRDTPTVRLLADRVDRAMRRTRGNSRAPNRADLVVLDPPRSGAGRSAIEQLVRRRPRAIAYVACDPAALARDLGYLAGHGYRPGRIRAFDLFPMTQHLEAVAIVKPQDADTAGSQ
jgi:tRNA/tmRNA/rRNA uracil-C5-methylase (TrmA/RlmC/RlmD family)